MEEWIKIASQFGIPAAALFLLVWKGWPFFVEQVRQMQASNRALEDKLTGLSDKFADTIRARDVMMAEIQERNLKALEGLASKIDGSNSVKTRRK